MKGNSLALEKPHRGAPIIERIKWKIVLCSGILDTPCWLWTGSCSNGYGVLSVSKNGKRRMIYVHRWLYEHHVGQIPPAHVLHHKCDTPPCVNPAHLDPMTQRHNIRQFTTKQTHCKHGHPLSGDNLYVTPAGTRCCRACIRKTQRQLSADALLGSKDRKSFKCKRLPKGASILDRVKSRIVEQAGPLATPCWIWMGSLCGPGYGQIIITENGRSRRAMVHRWMFEHRFGPPPDGADVHHKCDTPRCVNPEHLEAVSHRENIRKTTEKITHCKHGHPLSGPNVRVTSDGHRYCRACNYRRVRNHVKQRDKARKSTLRALEPMTQRPNSLQFTTNWTHCTHGHPLSGDNLYVKTGGIRACRECNRKCQRRFRANADKSKDRNSFKYKRLPKGASVLDRIKARIVEQEGPLETPCWIWMGSLCGPGYGQIKITENGRSRRALVHRWMFGHRFGPPPDGADVHHKCDARRCVNPEHLEVFRTGKTSPKQPRRSLIANMGIR